MANENKTLAIGTIFTYNGNKYKVCKADESPHCVCSKCAFNRINCDTIKDIRGKCAYNTRIDWIQVYYEKINNETMNKDNDTKENVVIPIFNTDNSLSDIKIECPKGYIIDVEHSDLSKGIIKFKKNNITLEDIYEDKGKDTFITNVVNNNRPTYNKIAAIATLMDIANYYNKGWNNGVENKYHIVFDCNKNCYYIGYKYVTNSGNIFFKNKVDAQSVIDNPNFRDILDTIYKD